MSESPPKPIRKIIHIDMDAFYAAVEQRDFPEYRNKPIIVGGSPKSRGVVATCSYEARQYGIRSAMSSAFAYRLCPQAIFIKPRFTAYQEASRQIRTILEHYTPIIEPIALDEAYLDVTNSTILQGSASQIAKAIKSAIRQQTGLTASAGVSYNKFLAKIASDLNKPDGFYVILPEDGEKFAENLPIGQFHGIGKVTETTMHHLSIYTGKDLKQCSLAFLQQHFGKSALHYYHIARGIDERPVNHERIRKSIGVETTFANDLNDKTIIFQRLQQLLAQALAKLAAKRLEAYTVTIKIKYHDFLQITRSRTLAVCINSNSVPTELLAELVKNTEIGQRPIRLLGVSLSSLQEKIVDENSTQLDLFNFIAK